MSKCIIYFFKEFRTNQYGLTIENESDIFSILLPINHENQVVGGILDRSKMASLRDFLNIQLGRENVD